MFEITSADIQALDDKDLRELVAMLCESIVREQGLSARAVTWGGNQTAKDGGLDVRVTLPKSAVTKGFIPRSNAGYQVKKPDMQRAAILAEMRPKKILRPVIKELADKKGGVHNC